MRWTYVAMAMWLALGCADGTTGPAPQPATAETFVGSWRSVTPSLEFIGLSVQSKSSEIGVLGVRLTYSGVAFDGNGRIEGSSLVADLTVGGATQPGGVLVARARGRRAARGAAIGRHGPGGADARLRPRALSRGWAAAAQPAPRLAARRPASAPATRLPALAFPACGDAP